MFNILLTSDILASIPLLCVPIIIRIYQYRSKLAINYQNQDSIYSFNSSSNQAEVDTNSEATNPKSFSTFQLFKAYIFWRNGSKKQQLALKFIVGNHFILFWEGISLIPFFVFYFTKLGLTPAWQHCFGCLLDLSEFIFYICMIFFIFLCGVIVAASLRNQPDPLRLLNEFIYIWISGAVIGGIPLILHIIDIDNIELNGVFVWRWLAAPAPFLMIYFQTSYHVFRVRKLNAKHLNIREFNVKDIETDIFNDTDLKGLLRQHMKNELSFEILAFIDDVSTWKNLYKQGKKDGMQRNARRIFDTYISRGAFQEINISSSCRTKATMLCTHGNVDITVFDEALKETTQLLEGDVIPRFLHSRTFKQYQKSGAIIPVEE